MYLNLDLTPFIKEEFHPAIKDFLLTKEFGYKEETFFGIGSSLYTKKFLLQGVGVGIWFYKKGFIFKKELSLTLEEWGVLAKVLSNCDRYARDLKIEENRKKF